MLSQKGSFKLVSMLGHIVAFMTRTVSLLMTVGVVAKTFFSSYFSISSLNVVTTAESACSAATQQPILSSAVASSDLPQTSLRRPFNLTLTSLRPLSLSFIFLFLILFRDEAAQRMLMAAILGPSRGCYL